MTDAQIDAALDVWFGGVTNWRCSDPDVFRARMRRVLEAHDATARVTEPTEVMLEIVAKAIERESTRTRRSIAPNGMSYEKWVLQDIARAAFLAACEAAKEGK